MYTIDMSIEISCLKRDLLYMKIDPKMERCTYSEVHYWHDNPRIWKETCLFKKRPTRPLFKRPGKIWKETYKVASKETCWFYLQKIPTYPIYHTITHTPHTHAHTHTLTHSHTHTHTHTTKLVLTHQMILVSSLISNKTTRTLTYRYSIHCCMTRKRVHIHRSLLMSLFI